MAILTTRSTDTPSLGNLIDELGNPLTDDLEEPPPDGVSVRPGHGHGRNKPPKGQIHITTSWHFI